jgi:hypothetical protein
MSAVEVAAIGALPPPAPPASTTATVLAPDWIQRDGPRLATP